MSAASYTGIGRPFRRRDIGRPLDSWMASGSIYYFGAFSAGTGTILVVHRCCRGAIPILE